MDKFFKVLKDAAEGEIAKWILRLMMISLTSVITYVPTHIFHKADADVMRGNFENIVQQVEAEKEAIVSEKSNGCR
jgi:hypothetical protein